jgi:hypothetical protein
MVELFVTSLNLTSLSAARSAMASGIFWISQDFKWSSALLGKSQPSERPLRYFSEHPGRGGYGTTMWASLKFGVGCSNVQVRFAQIEVLGPIATISPTHRLASARGGYPFLRVSSNGRTYVSLTDLKSLSNWLKEIYTLSHKDFEKVSLQELAALGMEMLMEVLMNAATKTLMLGITEEQRRTCKAIVNRNLEDNAVDNLKGYFDGFMVEHLLPPILADWARQSFDQVEWRELVQFFKG